MSFEDDPADDRYQLDQCIDEIKSLQAEVAALRAACEHVFAMIEVELYESPADDQWHIAAAKLRDAINKTEPTK